MIQYFFDMDKQEKIRCVSESSNTSGYWTGGGSTVNGSRGNNSPSSAVSLSPAQSPATVALSTEFSTLNLPSSSNSPQPFTTLDCTLNIIGRQCGVTDNLSNNVYMDAYANYASSNMMNQIEFGGSSNILQQQQLFSTQNVVTTAPPVQIKHEYPARLVILEQPVEKFRFRYKSEMHGTHGSLHGAKSQRTTKSFPEVELKDFKGPATIRCSLFQTNLDSPHSHQLVVRREEGDICDPHDLRVSEERGYLAQFQNMGIIHTAKKYIFDELLRKKQARLHFQMNHFDLSTKQLHELHKDTEKEAKCMNLNQVRLCFEAFKSDGNGIFTPIAEPVYTMPINNRKSAQTGELRITRLSIATGNVSGNDELILLVEKVSKKNIKVRFFETNEYDETVWEAYSKFRESDVHHQYAIVCATPPYKDKDIDKPVEVFIELVRPSDDERSFPPLPFRYKPRDSVASRKRRRTCSTATTSSSGTSSACSSIELPKTVQEQVSNLAIGVTTMQTNEMHNGPTISEDFNKEGVINDVMQMQDQLILDSEELIKICGSTFDFPDFSGELEVDGSSANVPPDFKRKVAFAACNTNSTGSSSSSSSDDNKNRHLQRIFKIYNSVRSTTPHETAPIEQAAKQIEDIFMEYSEHSDNGDTLLHDIITGDNLKMVIQTFQVIAYFKLQDLVNRASNADGQTALHCACLHDRATYMRPLLGLGCNPNVQDRHGNTALHIAVKEEHKNCINSFLNMDDIKLDMTVRNDEGLTSLHLAIKQNNYIVAKKLLKYNRTSINVANIKDGNNALHMAVLEQKPELIVLILDAQNVEDIISARNAAGHTPLDLAKQLNDTVIGNKIVELLTSVCKDLTLMDNRILKIKDEEFSSSSTEDDDESSEAMETQSVRDEEPLMEIKEEFVDIDDDERDRMQQQAVKVTKNTPTVEEILNDATTFKRLVYALNQKSGKNFKWKLLAEKLKIDHLVILWKNAQGMLDYIKSKSGNIPYKKFANALAEVDPGALLIIVQSTSSKGS